MTLSVNKAMSLYRLGILKELTGRKRNQVFSYQLSMEILAQ